jgi:hemerythrin-like domain-containing protein
MHTADTQARPTEALYAEHEVILVVLDCLEKIAGDAAATKRLDLASARDALDFLRTFADRCHHGKEENVLFPALMKKGMPRHMGPLAVMLAEHEEGRAAIAGMVAAVEDCAREVAGGVERFATFARRYVDLLRDHIAKENGILFPMAEGMLDDEERADVLAAYARVEHHDMGEGTHERYLALVDRLVVRLGITPSARPAHASGGCCGHGPHGCH